MLMAKKFYGKGHKVTYRRESYEDYVNQFNMKIKFLESKGYIPRDNEVLSKISWDYYHNVPIDPLKNKGIVEYQFQYKTDKQAAALQMAMKNSGEEFYQNMSIEDIKYSREIAEDWDNYLSETYTDLKDKYMRQGATEKEAKNAAAHYISATLFESK